MISLFRIVAENIMASRWWFKPGKNPRDVVLLVVTVIQQKHAECIGRSIPTING
jgi:hypothetical protein